MTVKEMRDFIFNANDDTEVYLVCGDDETERIGSVLIQLTTWDGNREEKVIISSVVEH